jgi:hypothetical protein
MDCTWFRPLARVLLMVCCLAGFPHLALASANSLFIEAFRAWEAAETASSPVERLKLLEVCQAKLDEIVRENPDSDVAVQIATRGKVGEFDLSLVGPALEDARKEVGKTDPFNFSEHIDRMIEDLQRQDFKAAWDRYLDALILDLEQNPSRTAARSIMAWRIEREVEKGNISGADDLIEVALLVNERLYSSYGYDGGSVLHEYLVEILLHMGRQDDVVRIISELNEGPRHRAIDTAVIFFTRHGDRKSVETMLRKYSSDIKRSPEIHTIVSELIARDWDPLVQSLLKKVHHQDTKTNILLKMAESYIDRHDLLSAEAAVMELDVDPWYIRSFTKSRYVSLLFCLAGSFGEMGDLDKADFYLERASKRNEQRQIPKTAEVVESLVKMGRIEDARKLTGLTDPDGLGDSKILIAYFENLPTEVAIRELSNYKDYLLNYKETFVAPKGTLYIRFLIHQKQFDAVKRILMDSAKNSDLNDEAIDKLIKTISRYLDEDEHQRHFVGWLRQVKQIRPSLDTALHLVDRNSTAEEIRAGLNAIESYAEPRDYVSYYLFLAGIAINAEKLTTKDRNSLVADALLNALSHLRDTELSDFRDPWGFLGSKLRAVTLDRTEPEFWRVWPRLCIEC